ncbi:ATP-binding protein [Parabacteroides distasonis]|nr:ATP-binding protein [Parabacteroides distasonis]
MVKIDGEKRHRIPFSQRLFWSVFFMFLGFTVCFLLFQYQREREFAQEKLNNVLSNYNYQLFRKCQQSTDINQTVISFMDDIPQKDLRVTIIDPSGDVLFDNSGTDEFNNHNDRSEVRKARLYNEGFAIRSSESTGKRYFYSASNIGGYIYRSALPYDPYVRGILTVNKDFIYFMALMTLIFFFVLSRFTFSIGKTISKLRDFALNVEKDRMPAVDYVFPNDELGDISQNIVTLYHRQQKAKNELSMEREKLIKHFQYSKEGFAMFTSEGREILSNILFIQFINVISDTQIHQVEDVTDIAELEPIRTFLNKNIRNLNRKKKVLRESVTIDKNGKIFLIECILFLDNSYEISINDISRQEEESRMKRQLTQNVSHELKTPVSSIQGYLETILSNPDLSPDKRQFFLERCYSQSTRLTGLLRDISVLNRLDEASEMFDLTEVNITKLIAEIQKECSQDMEEKHITSEIILPGDPTVFGNNSLLYSIFRNLYDNAIAYAGENIRITVNCYKEDPKYYYFSFSDNGVGIPEEHINRIFERFYRVDKGRSRKIGGTGLGLSIVKNGVNFHKGQISAKSSPGKGVTFFLHFEKETIRQTSKIP